MRFFEISLIVLNIAVFCILAIRRTACWFDYAVPAALLIAVIGMAVEGFRWQMIPAYALTAIFVVLWLFSKGSQGGMQVSTVVSFLGLGLGVVAIVISIGLPVMLPVFSFPKPTGPYGIGTLTYHWADMSRSELFTADPNDPRELMVQMWYPTGQEPSMRRAPYIRDADVVTPVIGRFLHLPEFVFSHLKYVTTNAVASAPVADDQPDYPVLLYLSGISGFRSANTFQIEELVSHGYIVIGLDQPGIAPMVRFPDGRQIPGLSRDEILPLNMQSVEAQPQAPTLHGQPMPEGSIPYFARDVSFVLDQLAALNKSDPHQLLTGRLDLERIGTFGISLGGMNAAQASLEDLRLKACLIMDVNIPAEVVEKGLTQPTMFITRSADTMRFERDSNDTWAEKDVILTVDTMRRVYESLPGDGYYVEIEGIFHINFTDVPYWSPVLPHIGITGPINAQRGFDIINAYSLAFFDRELKGQHSPLLGGQSEQYPEVKFESLK